jgi:hypothetical protein
MTIAHRLRSETEGLLQVLKLECLLSRGFVALEFSYLPVACHLGRRIQLKLGRGVLKGSSPA